jgi:hypothetical protein
MLTISTILHKISKERVCLFNFIGILGKILDISDKKFGWGSNVSIFLAQLVFPFLWSCIQSVPWFFVYDVYVIWKGVKGYFYRHANANLLTCIYMHACLYTYNIQAWLFTYNLYVCLHSYIQVSSIHVC